MSYHFTSLSDKLKAFSDRSGGPDACWEWQREKNPNGYGKVSWRGEYTYAHRASWIETNGTIGGGLWVLHKCDNPSCINPAHLFLGTQFENMKDAVAKGRHRSPFGSTRGERNVKAKLTEQQVREIRARYSGNGETQRSLAREFGVSQGSVALIINRQTWKHVD